MAKFKQSQTPFLVENYLNKFLKEESGLEEKYRRLLNEVESPFGVESPLSSGGPGDDPNTRYISGVEAMAPRGEQENFRKQRQFISNVNSIIQSMYGTLPTWLQKWVDQNSQDPQWALQQWQGILNEILSALNNWNQPMGANGMTGQQIYQMWQSEGLGSLFGISNVPWPFP